MAPYQKVAEVPSVYDSRIPHGDSERQGYTKSVMTFVIGFFVGSSLILMNRPGDMPSNEEVSVPMLGSPKQGDCRKDLFGKVFNQVAVISSDGVNGVYDKFTSIFIPNDDGVSALYFIASAVDTELGVFEGKDYFEYGTVTVPDNGATHDFETNCELQFVTKSYFGGEWQPIQSGVFPANSWDGGKSWIVSGIQEFGGVTTSAASVMTVIGGKTCKHRAKVVREKFAENGVDVSSLNDINALC